MKKILIIDGQNNAYRAYHSYKNLSYKGKSTSVAYGLISIIRSNIGRIKPNKVFICWDHSKSKHRLDIHPEYKGTRKTNNLVDKEDLFRQRDEAMVFLKYLGITQVHGSGMEADDWMYYLIRKYKGHRIYILSSDKDFDQLVNNNVSIIKPNKKLHITTKNIESEMGYKAKEVVDYLSLVGDNSDNIPGYPGIGPAKARKFLDEFGSIRSFLKDSTNNFPPIDRDVLLELHKINRALIDLPYFFKKFIKGKIKINYHRGLKNPKLKVDSFYNKCRKNNYTSFMDSNFVKPFKQVKNGWN